MNCSWQSSWASSGDTPKRIAPLNSCLSCFSVMKPPLRGAELNPLLESHRFQVKHCCSFLAASQNDSYEVNRSISCFPLDNFLNYSFSEEGVNYASFLSMIINILDKHFENEDKSLLQSSHVVFLSKLMMCEFIIESLINGLPDPISPIAIRCSCCLLKMLDQ